MVVSRSCSRAVGRWDEGFFLYSEETDFALRARDLGFKLVYQPEAHVQHLGGESRRSPRLYSMLVVNKVRLFAKRHGRPLVAGYWFFTMMGEAVRCLRGSTIHRAAFGALVFPSRRPLELHRQSLDAR